MIRLFLIASEIVLFLLVLPFMLVALAMMTLETWFWSRGLDKVEGRDLCHRH